MILKVFGVLQLILVQVISAQISPRDLAIQNVLNYLENTGLAGCSRSRRQINTPPVNLPGTGNLPGIGNLPGTGNLPVNEFTKTLSLKNDRSFGNSARGNGSPNNLALNNGQTRSTLNMGLPNSSPVSSLRNSFLNMNILPQNLNRLPNGNNNNGLPINNIPNGLKSFNHLPNGLPGFNNVPNGLPGFNNLPSGLPGVNNIPNGLPNFNNLPSGLPGFNNLPNGLPRFNNIPKGLPDLNNIPSGFSSFNNNPSGLPGVNNVPNGLPSFNNLPNSLPSSNNLPNGLPSFNNLPNGLPSFNNLPKGLPSFNNVPNGLPGFNNIPTGLPGVNNIPSAMPGINIMPNGLPNQYNLPSVNTFQNLINIPAGNNILNSNNLSGANSLPNINNIPITNNNFPCGIAYPVPVKSRMPLNNLESGKILPPMNNKLPFLNNFRITEIGIGNGFADVNRFPRNDQPNSNALSNAIYLQNINKLAQPGSNELSNLNGFSVMNTPTNTEVVNNAQANNLLSSGNNFPNINSLSNFAGEAENINTMQLNNAMGEISNIQNYDVMPVNEQGFVNNVPFNNDFTAANNFLANTVVQNANSRLINAINDGMPLSNGGYLNDILFGNNAGNMQDTHTVQNIDGNVFSSNNNDFQFDNIQVPVNWNYETVGTQQPDIQIVLPDGVELFSNMPSDNQAGLMANSLSLAQELVGNLQIEGLDNMPFLNGLPVAGITETVTVLNR